MKKRRIICRVFYCIGLIIYLIFLDKLQNISNEAWLYGLLSAIGMAMLTVAIWERK